MSVFDWGVLVIVIPLALYGWWIKYGKWRDKQRRIVRQKAQLLSDLRRGKL